MIGYNPSHLNTNETLLEAFHRVEAYLKANPQYQVYQSSAWYDADKSREYALDTIIVPEGSKVGAGDVVLFVNAYVAVIIAVSETTFTVDRATYLRGQDGVTPNIRINADVDNNVGVPSVSVTKSGTNTSPIFDIAFHNLKGEVGQTGATGATGATPNLDINATVDNKVGEPSVTVYKSGTNLNPVFHLDFHKLKGEVGQTGATGETGATGATPDISMNASVDNNVGTPSVEVTKGGTSENPTFSLSFKNLKGEVGQTGATGETGATGATPNINVNATVDNNVGVPTVEVTKGGTSENPAFSLAFKNLKGEVGQTGATGAKGNDALVYTADNGVRDSKLVSGESIYIQNSSFNRSPVLNDVFVLYDTYNQYGILKCIFVETERSQFSILTVVSTKGATGATGAGVPSGGTAGQVLGKRSATDYDTEWVDAGGGGGSLTKHSVSLTKENVATYVAQFENMIAPQLKVTTSDGTLILPAGKQLAYNEISGSAITMNDWMFVFAGCNGNSGRFCGYYLPNLSGVEGTVPSWSYNLEGFTISAMDLIWYTLG